MCSIGIHKGDFLCGLYLQFCLLCLRHLRPYLPKSVLTVSIPIWPPPCAGIRTAVVLLMSWLMVFVTDSFGGISEISKRSWIFLVLSGLATGASWLCYYKALQMGNVSKVVPIDKLSVVITLVLAFVFLHEQFTVKSLIGCVLISAGTLVMVL